MIQKKKEKKKIDIFIDKFNLISKEIENGGHFISNFH